MSQKMQYLVKLARSHEAQLEFSGTVRNFLP